MAKRIFTILFLCILQTLGVIGRFFSQIVAILIFIFVPFQSDTYLRVYLKILQNVEPTSPACTFWRRQIALIGLLLRFKSLHLFYLFLFPSQTDFDVFLHFDILEHLIPNIALNGVDVFFLNLVVFFNERMFFHVQKQLIDRLVAVIHHQSSDWFLSRTYKGKRIPFLFSRLYAAIFNLQSTYQLVIEIVIIWFESSLLCTALPQLTALTLFSHFFSFLGFLLFVVNFFFIIPLAFTILLTSLAMFYLKMSQIYRQLGLLIKKQRPLSYCKLTQLKESFSSTFLFFLRINSMYRWIFVSFLLVTVPLNVIITIRILSNHIPAKNLAFTLYILCYTFLFIFIFHLAFAYPSKAIHRFGPLFQHTLVCKYPTTGKTRSRIRLSHLIFAFHVPAPNRYGFNYGNWGLVNVQNFLKYLVIYSKLAMTLYKLLNK